MADSPAHPKPPANASLRELRCLRRVVAEMHNGHDVPELAAAVVDIVGSTWDDEAGLVVRIELDGRVYGGCEPAAGAADYPIQPVDRDRGRIVVGRCGDEAASSPPQFTDAQRELVQAVADLLGEAVVSAEAQHALRESEERYRQLFNAMSTGFALHEIICDDNGLPVDYRFLEANPAFERLTGLRADRIVGRRVREIIPDLEDYWIERYGDVALTGKPTQFEAYSEPLQRHWEVIAYSPAHGKFATIFVDTTERRQLEDQLLQAQKMESVGRLAGGIAHDFNNVLTVIVSYCDLAQAELRPEEPLLEHIGEIRRAADHATGLTRQILAYSRRQVLRPELANINTIVLEQDGMLRRLLGEDIDLVTRLASEDVRVQVDRSQLEQVIANLAVNARDAMPGGGKLTIETDHVELDDEYAATHPEVTPGSYVVLAITDNGCGMDLQTKTRIFEPFFTTKGRGLGTGLGLSTVYGIVRQSGGFIWVYSELDKGTTFKIYLPVASGELTQSPPARRGPIPTQRGTETLLVVEDDEHVLRLTTMILAKAGYSVLEAKSGEEAERLAEEHPGPIHMLVTDVVMPGASGRVTADRIVAKRPDLRVLYMSGYTDNAIVHHGVLDPGTAFIQKPFSPSALTEKVRKILDGSVD